MILLAACERFRLLRCRESEGYGSQALAQIALPNLHLHPADFVGDVAVERVLAEGAEVGIFGQPFEIAVTELEGVVQRRYRQVQFAVEGVAASEIVEDQRVARFEVGQSLVHGEAVIEPAALGVVVAEHLQRFDVVGVAGHDAFQKANFDVEIARFLSRKLFSSGTAFLRHTTVCNISNGG